MALKTINYNGARFPKMVVTIVRMTDVGGALCSSQ